MLDKKVYLLKVCKYTKKVNDNGDVNYKCN